MSAIRLVEAYHQFPGKCFFTGSSKTDKPILDTGQHLDFDGHVYMSGDMLEEACRLLGWTPPEEKDELAAQIVALRAELDQAQTEIEQLEVVREAVRSAAERLEKPNDPAPRLLSDIQG